ncbi:MAG: glycine--tRNA ligase subunit beta [Candidatus Margulisiibacteriota bacterium]
MSNNFLLEIGTEEIPSRFLEAVLADLKRLAEQQLQESDLQFSSVETLGTPRRLVLFIRGLEDKQQDKVLEIKGPPRSAAFDKEGGLTKAAEGFAKAQGIDAKKLIVKDTQSGDYVFAVVKRKGKSAEALLKESLPKLVEQLPLPVSMKWGDGTHSFIRPLHYILAVLGSKPVKLSFKGKASSNKSRGHRLLDGNKTISYSGLADMDQFKSFLAKHGVVLSKQDRLELIKGQIKDFEKKNNIKIKQDLELLNETANLAENPSVVAGSFLQQFLLVLPQDVIATVVKKQQKCFPSDGAAFFLIVSDGGEKGNVKAGYEQVVNARLSDAKFFYDEDLKNTLDSMIEKTKKITFLEKAGSMFEKTARVSEISKYICHELLDKKDIWSIVERSCSLLKFDLSSHMVGEFSSLAGIMGREYCLVMGEDSRVARAVYEHYLPRFSGDDTPKEIYGAVCGIADRIDTLCACFAAGLIPTGSEDPYALRRAAQGIVSIILAMDLSVDVDRLLDKALEANGTMDPGLKKKLSDFIGQRLKAVLEGEGIKYDVCDALINGASNLTETYCKAFVLNGSLANSRVKGIIMCADRIGRIAGKAESGKADTSLFIEDGEKKLYSAFVQTKDLFNEAIGIKQQEKALLTLANLTPAVEEFFEKVLVMHQDENIRKNRLALLNELNGLYLRFADLGKIVI